MPATTTPAPARHTVPRLRLFDPAKPAKPAKPDRSWTIRKPVSCGHEVRVLVIHATPQEWAERPESRDPMWVTLPIGENVIGVMVDGW